MMSFPRISPDRTSKKVINNLIDQRLLGTQNLEMFKLMAEMMKDQNANMVQAMTSS